jgi:hypothetical protein
VEAVEFDPSFRMAERFSSLTACQGSPFRRPPRNGVPLLPMRAAAPPVTLELVNKLRDELA